MVDKILKAARAIQADAERTAGNRYVEEDNLDTLLGFVADYFNPARSDAHCNGCGAPVVWVDTPRGKRAPLDAAPIVGLDRNGEQHRIHLSHFATCPVAKRYAGGGGNGKGSGR